MFDAFIVWLRDRIYHHLVCWLIKWRYAAIGIPVALVMISVGLVKGGHIKSTFFPMVDFDRFEINVAFTPGSGEKQTIEYLKRFETAVWAVNDDLMEQYDQEDNIIERVGTNLGRSFAGQESGAHAGTISVFPRDLEGLPFYGFDLANMVRKKIGSVPEAQKFTVGGRNRWGSPISIGLMSKNLEELEQAKEYLMMRLTELPQLKDINENVALGKQEIRLDLKPKAYFLGLNESIIANQVRQGFYGGQAQRLQEGRDELRVWVRYPKSDRLNRGQLERMKIKTSAGEFPLIELADYHMERGPVSIKRFNGSREIRVEAETLDPFTSVPEIIDQIEREIMPELVAMYAGTSYTYQGQQKFSNEALDKILKYYALAFLAIFLILVIHFKSAYQSLIVLLMIPLSILGVFWGHGIHDKALSLMSLWGMVALTGVIINDAIVFLTKFDGLLREGLKVQKAIVEAGKVRLRPIILTTLTTTIGLAPIIAMKSVQAQFLTPMAISLAYGVAIGTIFILIFFPIIIMILNDFRTFTKYLWTGTRPEREDVEIAIIHQKRNLEIQNIKKNELEDEINQKHQNENNE